MSNEVLRTFVAVELDEPLRRAVARVQDQLKRRAPDGSIRWVAPEGIHLTLKFLGDTPRDRIADIEAALRAACTASAPFEVEIAGCGCFPSLRRPRVIWLGVHDAGGRLLGLQAAVAEQIAPLVWNAKERPFSLHLTLARVARGATPGAQAAIGRMVETAQVGALGFQQVSTVSLIRSVLGPDGAAYTTLVQAPLASGK